MLGCLSLTLEPIAIPKTGQEVPYHPSHQSTAAVGSQNI